MGTHGAPQMAVGSVDLERFAPWLTHAHAESAAKPTPLRHSYQPLRSPPTMEVEKDPGADMEALVRRLRLHQAAPSEYDPSPAVTPAVTGGELFRPRRAAVLVCLFRGAAGELRVILSKRASTLSTHSGEVALPGGKTEEGDADDAATALRESKEEIGLDPALHLLVVVPVVGILSDIQEFKPILNVAEVDEIFDVPLEMFLKDENRTSEEREKMGQTFTVHYFSCERESEVLNLGPDRPHPDPRCFCCIWATTGLS